MIVITHKDINKIEVEGDEVDKQFIDYLLSYQRKASICKEESKESVPNNTILNNLKQSEVHCAVGFRFPEGVYAFISCDPSGVITISDELIDTIDKALAERHLKNRL